MSPGAKLEVAGLSAPWPVAVGDSLAQHLTGGEMGSGEVTL